MAPTKKHYTLYLDESQTHKCNYKAHYLYDFHFCMAGIIIADDNYPKLEQSVNLLKRNIWTGLLTPENIILHQMLIVDAEKGRLDASKHPEYVQFNRISERRKFYKELKKIFINNAITIVGSSLYEDDLKRYYAITGRNDPDAALVAMQLLLENYCHFLCTNNGMGRIIYEHRELIEDERLRDRYYHMKLMGSMYMNKNTAEKRLLGIDFIRKEENNAGLQIADFVPLSFARDHAGINQGNPNIFSTLKYCRYNGKQKCPLPERFGVKYMP